MYVQARGSGRFVTLPLARQRLHGRLKARIWGQSLDRERPATWTISIKVVSRDEETERGLVLPLVAGGEADVFGAEMGPRMVGPFELHPTDVDNGDRLLIEVGSKEVANIDGRADHQAWLEFSEDLLFEDVGIHLSENRTSREVNQCIYCGETEGFLTKEHIVPKALNGELTLQRASCLECCDLTKAFEERILGGKVSNGFKPVRVALGMRSYRKREGIAGLPVMITKDGRECEVEVPLQHYPVVLALPVFAEPALDRGDPPETGIRVTGAFQQQLAGLRLPDLLREYGGTRVAVRTEYDALAFPRMIAKIAYGVAVLQLGLQRFTECYVLPAIRGEAPDIGRWVGCSRRVAASAPPDLHTVQTLVHNNEVRVFVRLFAPFGAPEYEVIVGRIG